MPTRSLAVAALCAVVAGVALGRFFFVGLPSDDVAGPRPATPRGDLAAATAALAASPDDPALLTRVGLAYLGEAKRTADPAMYARADTALERSRQLDPSRLDTTVARGVLALARHDFAGALGLAGEARRLAPLAVDPLGVQVDALAELGRYDEAAVTVDEMVRRRPDVASLSRASYVLELRGETDAAVEVMEQAVAAARERSADQAYVLSLLGDLRLGRGEFGTAASSYQRSLEADAGQPHAQLGLARVDVARGDLAAAAARLSTLTRRLPLPDALALHGDVLTALGDTDGARQQYALVRATEQLNRANGIAVDLELARFEAGRLAVGDGTDPTAVVDLARAARTARPTVYGDDVLAWALRNAGRPSEALPFAQQAVRTNLADSTVWWHLAAIEAELGHTADAAVHIEHAYAIGGPLPVLEAEAAASLRQRVAER